MNTKGRRRDRREDCGLSGKKPIKQEKASHRLFMVMDVIDIISISEICCLFFISSESTVGLVLG